MKSAFWICALFLASAAHCASARARTEESEPLDTARAPGEAPIHIRESDFAADAESAPSDAAMTMFLRADADDGPAVPSDAGVVSGELAYLVAHLAESPDRLRSTDSSAARQLADHGADGVRAVAEVFRRNDAQRLPFARTTIEHVAIRSCRHRPAALRRLTRWLEEGVDEEPPAVGTLPPLWWRDPDASWDSSAVDRVVAWANAGLPCAAVGADAGAGSPADASVTPSSGSP